MMEPVYYMEYSESFKIVNEMYTALYKYRNTKAWGPLGRRQHPVSLKYTGQGAKKWVTV